MNREEARKLTDAEVKKIYIKNLKEINKEIKKRSSKGFSDCKIKCTKVHEADVKIIEELKLNGYKAYKFNGFINALW